MNLAVPLRGCLRQGRSWGSPGLWWALLASAGLSGWARGEVVAFPEFTANTARAYLQVIVQTIQVQAGAEADGCFILARVQSQLGDANQAERLARQALERDPNRGEIQAFLAGLLIQQDRMEEAADYLRQALALKPEIPGGYRRLGMVLDRLGDREGARKALERGVHQDPQDAAAQLSLGRLLLDQGADTEAITHLRIACQLDPGSANAFYVLARAQTQTGDQESSRQSLKTYQQLKQKEKADLDARNKAYDDERFMRVLAAGFTW